MMREHARLQELAEALDVTATIHHKGDLFTVDMTAEEDLEYFVRQAFTPDLKVHTVTFDDPDFVPIWLAEVGSVMGAASAVDYELYVVGDRVRFSTQNPDTKALFTRFEEQGLFNGPGGGHRHWSPREANPADATALQHPTELEHAERLMERVQERSARVGHQNGRSWDLD